MNLSKLTRRYGIPPLVYWPWHSRLLIGLPFMVLVALPLVLCVIAWRGVKAGATEVWDNDGWRTLALCFAALFIGDPNDD